MNFFKYMVSLIKRIIKKVLFINNTREGNTINKFTYWSNKNVAATYNKNTKDPSLDNILNVIYCDIVEEYSSINSKILDIAAGTGVVSLELAKRGFDITATDISKEMLTVLNKKNNKIKIVAGDIFSTEFDHKFDVIVSRWFFPHMRDWPNLIRHISKNLLGDNGYLLFDMPNKDHINFASTGSNQISDDLFGYNDDPNCSDQFFYASSSDDNLKKAAIESGLEFIARIPHGFFKSNKLIANFGGDDLFLNNNKLSYKLKGEKSLENFLYSYEKFITPLISNQLVHGSIIVLKKI